MRQVLAILVLIGLGLGSTSTAQETKLQQAALSELSSELTECAVYYSLGAQCVENSPGHSNDTVERSRAVANSLVHMAEQFGRAGGVSQKAMEARIRLYADQMFKEIENSCANISILMEKHGQSCRRLAEAPNTRLQEILEEYQKRGLP